MGGTFIHSRTPHPHNFGYTASQTMFRGSALFIQMWGLNILYSLKFLLKQLFYHTFTLALHLPQRNLHHLLEARLCPHNFEYVERVGNLVRVSWQQNCVFLE